MNFSNVIQHVLHAPGQDHHSECVVLTVKHTGGSVMVRGRMGANGVLEMTFIDVTMNAHVYIKILADKMIPCLQRLGSRGIFQHGNDPKHTNKSFYRRKR